MDLNSGYVAEIDYTHGYYRELAPGLIDFALLVAGYRAPERAPLHYLELGYGQGLAVNIHAAACPGVYWGADLGPSHAANARALAEASGADAHLLGESFAAFAARTDLPAFDVIALHGVWGWIPEEGRETVLRILRERLAPGGVVYIGYNALPGWSATLPLRHLLAMKAAAPDTSSVIQGIESAIAFAGQIAEAGGRYFAADPGAKARLATMQSQNRTYLAHEYFNSDWRPMHFAEADAHLSRAWLEFACPARVLDQLLAYNLTPAQRALLVGISYNSLRETARDYLLNTSFRRDLYAQAPVRLSAEERLARLNAVRVALVADPADVPFEVEAGLGKVGLREDIFRPVIEALAAGDEPRRIADLADDPALAALPPGGLIEALGVLIGAGRAHPAQSADQIAIAALRCARLNARLIERARLDGAITWLASPVIGAGVEVSRTEQLFLGARVRGLKTPQDWAIDASSILGEQAGKLSALNAQAGTFSDARLPLLKRLGVAA